MMNGFALCLVYEQAGARHLVLAKLNDPTLLQQAARTAVLDAETRAGGLRKPTLRILPRRRQLVYGRFWRC